MIIRNEIEFLECKRKIRKGLMRYLKNKNTGEFQNIFIELD